MLILYKFEYEVFVLDIIKNDDLDIEDINDLMEVMQFMYERGRYEFVDWLKYVCRVRYLDVCYLVICGFVIMFWFKYMNVCLLWVVCFFFWRVLQLQIWVV